MSLPSFFWLTKWLQICFNFCRRAAMPLLMRLSRRIYPESGIAIFRIGQRTVLKAGKRIRLTEAATMRYIARNTNIPVPKVFDAWAFKDGGAAILMEWIEGAETLEKRWPLMSEEQKMRVACQLRLYIDELRTLEQPPEIRGRIGPLDGAPCWDERLKGQLCGPFLSERHFNQFRLSLLDCFRWEANALMSIRAIEESLREDHRIVFTHGDLGVRNILVDRYGDVVSIIDWEMSGWMPEYWEYVKTVHGRWEDDEWLSYAKIIAPPYEAEMAVDDQYIIVNGGAPF